MLNVDCVITAYRRTQAKSACVAFPYMVDAHMMVEAVADASKGGEAAFSAWTAQQLEHMRAVYGSCGREPCVGGFTCTTGTAASVDGEPGGAPVAIPTGTASGPAPEVAAPASAAEQVPIVGLRAAGINTGGEAVKSLSQLAAWHVGDVLRRAGVQPPPWRSAAAQPAAVFGCPPLT